MSRLLALCAQVRALTERCASRDPFEICRQTGIRVRYKDLGSEIRAFYFCQSRIRNIVLNRDVPHEWAAVYCAHELGHAVLHDRLASNRAFREIRLFDVVGQTEYEANLFAAELLLPDEEILTPLAERPELTEEELARDLSLPAELIDLKLILLKGKGVPVSPMYRTDPSFLKHLPTDGSRDA